MRRHLLDVESKQQMIKFNNLKSENEETHHFIMKPEKPRNEANQALENYTSRNNVKIMTCLHEGGGP